MKSIHLPNEDVQHDILSICDKHLPSGAEISICVKRGFEFKYFGAKKEDKKVISIDNKHTLFEIGSITKPMVSDTIMKLQQAGKINVDDEISNFIKELRPVARNIKLHEIMNHISGLPRLHTSNILKLLYNYSDPYANFGELKLLKFLKSSMKLKNQIGENYLYSNIGYSILSYIIENRTSAHLEDLLDELLFKPYNMSNTFLDSTANNCFDGKGYSKDGEVLKKWTLNAMKGAGGVISNVKDLSEYITETFKDHYVSNLRNRYGFEIDDSRSIFLGWNLAKQQGSRMWWHNGGTNRSYSIVAYNPSRKIAFSLLSNVAANNEYASSINDLVKKIVL